MRTYSCCPCCALATHQVHPLRLGRSQPYRDDHAYPCAKFPPNGPGRQEVTDAKLPWPARVA